LGSAAHITEREVRFAELLAGKPLYSAVVGRTGAETPALHRPDLVIVAGEGPIAVEVELTPKAPRRLERIIRGWRRSQLTEKTVYLSPKGSSFDAVERAIERTQSSGKVKLVELEGALNSGAGVVAAEESFKMAVRS
jgi:hypothetical protein